MSHRGMAFLKKCFIRDSNERPSAMELLRDPWLRGVENAETRQLYEDFEEHEVEIMGEIVRTDLDLNGHAYADGNAAVDDDDEYEEDEEGARARHEVEEDEDYHGQHPSREHVQEMVLPPFEHDFDKNSAEMKQSPIEDSTDNKGDVVTVDTVNPVEKEEDDEEDEGDLDGQSSPSNESVVSEVGSEVEMMLGALREREEGSRQVSKVSSPTPSASEPHNFPYASDGGLEIVNGESGNHKLMPSMASVVSSGASLSLDPAVVAAAAQLATTSSIDPARFGREMGLDLYSSLSPEIRDTRGRMSPVMAVKLMEKGPFESLDQELLAREQGLPQETEVSRPQLDQRDQELEKSLEDLST
ncbi:hypothetical protein BG004_000070 [Podila humilis]|nr:hypothetical protein BG004_000070 [Podila humilis]